MKTSPAANDDLKDELIRHTRQVWQPRLGRELNREDARQIVANMTGFFSVLAEWSCAVTTSPANERNACAVSEPTETQT